MYTQNDRVWFVVHLQLPLLFQILIERNKSGLSVLMFSKPRNLFLCARFVSMNVTFSYSSRYCLCIYFHCKRCLSVYICLSGLLAVLGCLSLWFSSWPAGYLPILLPLVTAYAVWLMVSEHVHCFILSIGAVLAYCWNSTMAPTVIIHVQRHETEYWTFLVAYAFDRTFFDWGWRWEYAFDVIHLHGTPIRVDPIFEHESDSLLTIYWWHLN